ncbi:hypothetical protein SSA02_05370 [Swaminathania salitolerans]|uniref:Uncharacterized protein n=2 Tax=Swaminathania salitolerans TaxID=182838 RepID=A0A511BNZ1_9PROT|nr:hypothetical protein SSA02_05370 [Swaminathania salitolerans]
MLECASALTAILRRETRARHVRHEAEAAMIAAERAVLESNDEDSAVEGFVSWLPEARDTIERARAAEREVGIDVAVAYQAFVMARNASEHCPVPDGDLRP